MTEKGDPNEVTIGEVYRAIVRMDGRLDVITKDMVGRQEYEADHEATATALAAAQKQVADERAEREAGDRRVEALVEKVRTEAANGKKWAVTTALGGGSLFLAGLAFIVNQLTGGPT